MGGIPLVVFDLSLYACVSDVKNWSTNSCVCRVVTCLSTNSLGLFSRYTVLCSYCSILLTTSTHVPAIFPFIHFGFVLRNLHWMLY